MTLTSVGNYVIWWHWNISKWDKRVGNSTFFSQHHFGMQTKTVYSNSMSRLKLCLVPKLSSTDSRVLHRKNCRDIRHGLSPLREREREREGNLFHTIFSWVLWKHEWQVRVSLSFTKHCHILHMKQTNHFLGLEVMEQWSLTRATPSKNRGRRGRLKRPSQPLMWIRPVFFLVFCFYNCFRFFSDWCRLWSFCSFLFCLLYIATLKFEKEKELAR